VVAVAALAMSLSSASVIVNALRLRRDTVVARCPTLRAHRRALIPDRRRPGGDRLPMDISPHTIA
jgi:hypothetical protein